MSKSPLSFYASYYVDTKVDPAKVTNYGGLLPYLDLMLLTDLPNVVNRCLPARGGERGWQHAEHTAALLALNLVGGDCVDDLEKLNADPGISLYMGQTLRSVGAEDRRWRKGRRFSRGGDRDIPSVTSVREWLDQFHNAKEDAKRGYGQAFVPEANEALRGLREVNREFVTRGFRLYRQNVRPPVTRATLEIDATYMETQKKDALKCYKHFDSYSGLTVRWAEMGFALWDEFRDGNVPPGHRNLEGLFESISYLNEELGITDVWVRSDAAAHQERIISALSGWEIDGEKRPVKFAIGYIKTKEFREEVRKLKETEWEKVLDRKGRVVYEVAEVPFVSNREAMIKAEPYRHIVIRRRAKQGVLPGLGTREEELGYEETMEMGGVAWHMHAIISNIGEEWTNSQVAEWYNERCGGGEAIHSILKSDLAVGQLPSNKFGANAAWWSIAILAYNLHMLLEKLALPGDLSGSRFKRLRFHLINVPARLIQHARRCCVRYFEKAALDYVQYARGKLAALAVASG